MTDRAPVRRRGLLRRLETPGLGRRQTRVLNAVLVLLLLAFTAGWSVAIVDAARREAPLELGRELAPGPLSPGSEPPVAYLLDRLAREAEAGPWRGRSGAVRAIIREPGDSLVLAEALGLDSLPPLARIEVQQVDSPGVRSTPERVGSRPGAWQVLLRVQGQVRRLGDVAVLNPVSSELLENGRIGRYLIGEWPGRRERPAKLRTPAYDPPRGFIAVTPANRDVPVSAHLTLGDFLTKGQADVWPKYVVISPRLLDKLELTIQELERSGHPVEDVGVISGFRTPRYNATGGDTSGRGSVSRHMYGDAMDFYIDNDHDGGMDDLDGDGRVTKADARIVAEAADRVERRYPEYVGGIGTYGPNSGAHSGFVHIDTRGYRARW